MTTKLVSRRRRVAGAVAALLIASVGAAIAKAPDRGRALYEANGCYQCHGYAGQGGAALRIAPSPYPFEAFAQLVRRPANEMPAYAASVLNDADLQAIYRYVRSVAEPPAVADIPELR
jgi:ubiquinol-cytochrome c reductase cytochrome c subunit